MRALRSAQFLDLDGNEIICPMHSLTLANLILLTVVGLLLGGFSSVAKGTTGQVGPLSFFENATTVQIARCDTTATGHVRIPAFINGKPVTSIAHSAFADCASVTSVAIPDSVTSIGNEAFRRCASLEEITFPPDAISLGFGAFQDCIKLRSVTLPPGITKIPVSAFAGCSSLIDVSLPESVTSIEAHAFMGCRSLASLDLPLGLRSVGPHAFQGCLVLESLVIPPLVTTIPDYLLEGCTALRDLILRGEVTLVGLFAFANCPELTTIELPASTSVINVNAFQGCRSLHAIHIYGGNPDFVSIDGVVFNKAANSLLIYPPGRVGKYSIPEGVTSVGPNAFREHLALSCIVFPSTFKLIQYSAFNDCKNLTRAVFLGDEPTVENLGLWGLSPEFTVFHYDRSLGFFSTIWHRHPVINMGPFSPVRHWILEGGFDHRVNVADDLNGDGVSLLTAYALGFDPRENLRQRMPPAFLEGGRLQLRFWAGAGGVSYIPETSLDLDSWTTAGISLSEPDVDGVRTASVPADSLTQFIRLRLQHD